MRSIGGKIVKIVLIVFMGLTAAMNILGGTGTVCAAFLTENYPSMSAILPYRWLYQIVMVVTIALGLAGVWATLKLIRGGETAYRNALILLAAGTTVGAVQVITSLALRGKAVPANMKLYMNAFTFILFLSLRLPGIREHVDFKEDSEQAVQSLTSGITAMVTGTLVLTTAIWVGNSHIQHGFSWVMVLSEPLIGSGAALLGMGLFNFLRLAIRIHSVGLIPMGRDQVT